MIDDIAYVIYTFYTAKSIPLVLLKVLLCNMWISLTNCGLKGHLLNITIRLFGLALL